MSKATFVIAGASLAGAKAAEELRTQGFDGRILLVGTEPERPYERPPLTKEYLRGQTERAKAYVHPEGFYAEQEIDLVTGVTVTAIDAAASRVTLDDGRMPGYDRLLLATGAEPRRMEVPGAGLDGVYYLRTLADCELLRERLEPGARVAVVGAGWIGSEFAASARQRGLEVTVIDPQPLPNARIFGREIGAFTVTCTCATVWSCCSATRSIPSKAMARSRGYRPPAGARSTAISPSSASAPCPARH